MGWGVCVVWGGEEVSVVADVCGDRCILIGTFRSCNIVSKHCGRSGLRPSAVKRQSHFNSETVLNW